MYEVNLLTSYFSNATALAIQLTGWPGQVA